VKILDLGIVRFTHDDAHSRLHGADVILGTLDYLAPEQAENSSTVDTRADIYALGATLYFLLAGHPPFPVADVRLKLASKQTQDPPPVHTLRPDVSEEFSAVVQRLMARSPADRYAAPGAVVAALHPWAVPGTDFPARLFRLSSDSTAHGRRFTDHEPEGDPMPDTLRITKPNARRAPAESAEGGTAGNDSFGALAPPVGPNENEPRAEAPEFEPEPGLISTPPPTDEIFAAPAADTEGGSTSAALTDEAITIPPEVLALSELDALVRAIPTPRPGESPSEDQLAIVPLHRGVSWQTVIGLGLAALAVGAGAAALLWLVGR
jgi:serine/threonine protein kinase